MSKVTLHFKPTLFHKLFTKRPDVQAFDGECAVSVGAHFVTVFTADDKQYLYPVATIARIKIDDSEV